MTDTEILQHAKSYIDKLANGIWIGMELNKWGKAVAYALFNTTVQR